MRYEKMLKDLKKLEASDRTTTHPAPAVHGPYSPWLNLQAAVGQPSTTPPAHLEAQAKLMNQLVRCSSAISSLTASLLAAMVSHSAGVGSGLRSSSKTSVRSRRLLLHWWHPDHTSIRQIHQALCLLVRVGCTPQMFPRSQSHSWVERPGIARQTRCNRWRTPSNNKPPRSRSSSIILLFEISRCS